MVLCCLGLIAATPGQAQTEDPNSALLALRKARDRSDAATLRKAIEMLKKAIRLDPASDTAHIWLAQVYLEKK
jgi:Tfp pilus assembly protein PilF